jgi:GNAT superfamily N-acetyltransferase
MSIRLARPDDYEQWLPLWRGYQTFYQVSIPQEVTDLTWRRFHDATEPIQCAVAEQNGVLIGLVHYIYHRSCWTSGDYCYLQDLFTVETVRGQGYGRALIEHVYQAAQAANASRVHWLTHETNHQAMLLYDRIADKSGFVQYRKILP